MAIKKLRRYATPIALAVVNLLLVGAWAGYLGPRKADLEAKMNSLQSIRSGLHRGLDDLNGQLERMTETRDRYRALVADGFLAPQDRMKVTQLLEELRKAHSLRSIQYEIAPERVISDSSARGDGFDVVSTKITIAMHGLFDSDLIAFVEALIDRFPGHVRPLSLSLRKAGAPTHDRLVALRGGTIVDFVAGEVVLEWSTLRSQEKTAAAGAS